MFEIIATDGNGTKIAWYTAADGFEAQDVRDLVRASFPAGSSNQVTIRTKRQG